MKRARVEDEEDVGDLLDYLRTAVPPTTNESVSSMPLLQSSPSLGSLGGDVEESVNYHFGSSVPALSPLSDRLSLINPEQRAKQETADNLGER